MEVVWDKRKAALNLAKHGIEFSHAATALDDPRAITIEDARYEDLRFVSVGVDLMGRVLTLVYSYPDSGGIRLISARKATPNERKQYEDEGI
ncbi:MAG: BrnT family toxin [Nitrospinota bacterium]|nr:BrnT family toxin [Nitrospinota bacterium]